MKSLRTALALVAPLFLAPLAAAQARVPGYLTLEGLELDIAHSLRWLCSQQDATTGAYGDVQITCFVLKAYAQSPWAYGYEDGPFVARAVDHLVKIQREDGAICEANASRLQQRQHTDECLKTLPFFKDAPGVAAAIERAKRFSEPPSNDASWEATFGTYEDAGILKLAEDTLANRKPEGWWENPMSRVRGTAVNTERLCGCLIALRARMAPLMASSTTLPPSAPAGREAAEEAARRGAAFLAGAARDGVYGAPGRPDASLTALAAAALLAAPEPRGAAADAAVQKALDWLASLQKADGSIHAGADVGHVTAQALVALARAGRPQDAGAIAKARAFLEGLQADESELYKPADRFYGGFGDGRDLRPSLASHWLALDALRSAGAEPGAACMQKAVSFLQRCQNLPADKGFALVRDGKTVRSGDDGGAAAIPGASAAGLVPLDDSTQVPRSTGLATAALLAGYLQAGVPRDDARVQAAAKWLADRFELGRDPGFDKSASRAAYEELYAYLHALARALDAYGEETLAGHAWRGELAGRLASMQREDGAWVNANADAADGGEGDPVVATARALFALEAGMPAAAGADK